jgi:hypothetical protein
MARKKRVGMPSKPKVSATCDVVERLHPSLRTKFIPLPDASQMLTDEQLAQVFSGDLTALRDVARLIRQTIQTDRE